MVSVVGKVGADSVEVNDAKREESSAVRTSWWIGKCHFFQTWQFSFLISLVIVSFNMTLWLGIQGGEGFPVTKTIDLSNFPSYTAGWWLCVFDAAWCSCAGSPLLTGTASQEHSCTHIVTAYHAYQHYKSVDYANVPLKRPTSSGKDRCDSRE